MVKDVGTSLTTWPDEGFIWPPVRRVTVVRELPGIAELSFSWEEEPD
nr:hypothetical protein [uncultured Methanospirillum sp.]